MAKKKKSPRPSVARSSASLGGSGQASAMPTSAAARAPAAATRDLLGEQTPAPPPSAGRTFRRRALVALAAGYLVTVWLDGVGSTTPGKLLPRPWVYFAQVAALFPHASPVSIDYRAEGWSCADRRWSEIDVRPFFRVDADTKESRFERALQFYRKNRTVMRALDAYVVERHNATSPRIGGVRFLSLRIPFPRPGEHVEPYARKPITSYAKEERHDWYWTPRSRRSERCGHAPEGPEDDAPVGSGERGPERGDGERGPEAAP